MPTNVLFDADGRRGTNGANGHDGAPGHSGGGDGRDGGDAGPASRGEDGGAVRVLLASGASLGEPFDHLAISGGIQTRRENFAHEPQLLSAAHLGEIALQARGGRGGDGGIGGDGGRGGRGRSGRDATKFSDGEDGGNGGNGGDGGHGTHGADGGHGGVIEVSLHIRDLYLLMAVRGAAEPQPWVAGGDGGTQGRHGSGGAGGPGGSGGSSCHWTETEYDTDSQGNRQSRTTHHSRSGGSSGWSGSSGHTPSTALYDGQRGEDGSCAFLVTGDDGRVTRYPKRYDLELIDFELYERPGRDADGLIEFGEQIHVRRITLRNVGPMPSPPHQRVRVTLIQDRWMTPLGDELYLAQSLAPGERATLEGELRLEIPEANITTPGEPFIVKQPVRVRVDQLGNEQAPQRGAQTPFQRSYEKTQFHRVMTVRFPVENRDGIIALRSLSPGETTRFSFAVSNVSQQAIGEAAPRARPVAVQIELINGEVSHSDVVFHNRAGKHIDLSGSMEGFRGYVERIPHIDPKGTAFVRAEVGFREHLPPYVGATLRASIWIDDYKRPGRWRLVQQRIITFRVEPAYVYHPDSKLLLVTNNNTTQDAFLAWQGVLRDSLGIQADYWSISRYGHFDLRHELDDQTDLRTHLEDRAVLVLNQGFHARSTEQKDLPSEYLKGRDFREGSVTNNTHFALIGSARFSLQQLLEPTSDLRRGGDDFPLVEQFLQKEARSAGSFVQETFKDDILTYADFVDLSTWTLFLKPNMARFHKKAAKLLARLDTLHPERRYVLVTHPNEAPKKLGGALFPSWHLGRVEVRRTLNKDASSAVSLRVEEDELNDPTFIKGKEARLVVLMALPFADKLDRLNWLLAREPDTLEPDQALTLETLVKAILIDLSEEQQSLRDSHGPLDEDFLTQKLSNFGRLLKHPLHTDINATSNKWEFLIELYAGVWAMAEVFLRWWRWFGRHRRISKYLLEKLRPLGNDWFNSYALDPTQEVAIHNAQERITERVRSLKDEFLACKRALSREGRRVGHDQAGLYLMGHPAGLKHALVRDIDVWTDPQSRLWGAEELARAQSDEQARESKQEQLRQINAQVRAAMLVPEAPAVTEAEPESVPVSVAASETEPS